MVAKWFVRGCCLIFAVGLSACASTDKRGGESHKEGLFKTFMAEERQWAALKDRQLVLENGMQIVYSTGGDPSDPTLVLLHGFSGDRNHWNRVAHELVSDFYLIVPDLPGHGQSSVHPEGDYSSAEMAGVMRDFVDTLGIERYHLAGHSMGGGLAIQWAMFRPQQIESLILVNSAGIYETNESDVLARVERGESPLRVAAPGDMQKVLDIAMFDPPFIPSQVFEEYEASQIDRVEVYDQVMAGMLATQDNLGPAMFGRALSSVSAPSLVLWGEKDRIFDVGVTRELEAHLRQPTVVTLERVGHTPLLEAPWRTAQAMRQFLFDKAGAEQ